MSKVELNETQDHIIRHSLGITNGRIVYRNHFAVSDGSDDHRTILELVEMGLMERGRTSSTLIFFHVTPAGYRAVGRRQKKAVRRASEADRDALYKCACGHPRSQHPRDRGCETRSCECKYFCAPQHGEASAVTCSACNVSFQDHLGVQKTCEKLLQAEGVLRELYEEFCPIYSGTSRICKRCHTGGGLSRPWRHAASCEMKRVEEYLSGLV